MDLKHMTQESMAGWMWATQHPFLYTVIQISTPTLLLMFIVSKLITGFINWKK
ncbi:MAG: hypothetical protein KBT36_03755 [Kurthia sp.]|nr:hypothetical protein [Candidatus Kurthia equi]